MFEASVYVERRSRLRKRLQSGLILLLGNDESPMNYADNTFPFRQDSSFLYYFGLDTPGLAAVMDLDAGIDRVYGEDLNVEDFVWMGYQPTIKERSLQCGVEHTGSRSELVELLQKATSTRRRIHFLPPYRAENRLQLFRWLGVHPDQARAEASVELIKAVVDQRASKSTEEIQQFEEAVNISVDMHLEAMRRVRPGATEAGLAAAVHEVALAAGGAIAFPIIATVHGETLHNHDHSHRLNPGDLFLLDAGAENSLHYAGDLSSTVPVDAKCTEQQREIYEITLAAHRAAVASLRPGTKHLEVHRTACRVLAQGLKDLGLMKGDVAEAVSLGAHALFFPCGVGHMMGLDVHDMEDLGEEYVGYDGQARSTQFGLRSLRLARELKPGFVLTTEPGIYFIPQLIDQWRADRKFIDFINYERLESYRGFGGIRNEENYLITTNGHQRLGKPKPMTLEEVSTARGD